MTVVPVPGLVHRHVVARAVRGLIDAVDGAPVPVPIAGLVARPDDAHAVEQVACQLDALDAAALGRLRGADDGRPRAFTEDSWKGWQARRTLLREP